MADHSSVITSYSCSPGIAPTSSAPALVPRFMRWFFLISLTVISHVGLAANARLEALTLIALAPLNARAVVKLPSGRLLTVKPGDELPETQATVRAVLNDKLVLDTPAPASNPNAIRQIWLYQATEPNGQSRVQYLDRTPPRSPARKPISSPPIEVVVDSRSPAAP